MFIFMIDKVFFIMEAIMTVKFFKGEELVYTIEAIELSYAICYINVSGIIWNRYDIV